MKKTPGYQVQVHKSHYQLGEYLDTSRWVSYFHQIQSVSSIGALLHKKNPSVLVIGVGDGIVVSVLKSMGMQVKSLDIDPQLHPDFVRALPDLNVPKRMKFDVIVCAEVLEHIAYTDAEKSLMAMSKVSPYVVISVPHKSAYISFSIKLPFVKTWKYIFSIPVSFLKHRFLGEHYWELGTRGYSVARFKKSLLSTGYELQKDFRVTELPWHHFFIAKKI